MRMVKVKDGAREYTYDMDAPMVTGDDGLAFYVSQLANVEAKIYETKYPDIVYPEWVPVDTSDPEYVDSVVYYYYNAVTAAKFIGANARDLPRSDMDAGKGTIPVFYGGNAYGWNLDELRKSQALRMPVDVIKGQASYRGFQELAQKTAFFGDADRGITGLFNSANVQKANATITPASATGAEWVAELNGQLVKVWQNSAEIHVPNVQGIPSDYWAKLAVMKMDTGTDTTVLEYYKKNNLYTGLTNQPLMIKPSYHLKTAGAGDVPRVLTYELNPENLTMRMPIAWRSLPPQPKGLEVEVPCEFKFGGVAWRYPGSAAYLDFT